MGIQKVYTFFCLWVLHPKAVGAECGLLPIDYTSDWVMPKCINYTENSNTEFVQLCFICIYIYNIKYIMTNSDIHQQFPTLQPDNNHNMTKDYTDLLFD